MTACPRCGYDPKKGRVENTRIVDMGLRTRTVHCLHAKQLFTVGDVYRWQAAETFNRLIWLPDFGKQSLNDWEGALKRLNDGDVTGR